MSVDRVNNGDTRIYVNNVLLTGITDCQITSQRGVENIRTLKRYEIVDRVQLSNPTPTAELSWIIGEQSTDPFFDFQNSGVVSVESFLIEKKDIVGTNTLSGAFLTSYSVNGGVGDTVTASASYEGINASYAQTGSLARGADTADFYNVYIPSNISLSATFDEGQIFTMPIQTFSVDVPISRRPVKKLGDFYTEYRMPELPAELSISFSAVKNDVTGLDFTKILLETGNFRIEMNSCNNVTKAYDISGCSLLGVSESSALDGNATVDFSYVASLTNSSFNFSNL
ncbi:hypothetical protein N9955_00815 [bacterium]|nr:hypothetical protein [bacterium]